MALAKREWWTPRQLRNAARLLNDAAANLNTTWPHSERSPCEETLPAVKAMIASALECVKAAQPTE